MPSRTKRFLDQGSESSFSPFQDSVESRDPLPVDACSRRPRGGAFIEGKQLAHEQGEPFIRTAQASENRRAWGLGPQRILGRACWHKLVVGWEMAVDRAQGDVRSTGDIRPGCVGYALLSM
jgi:hypothetical protein